MTHLAGIVSILAFAAAGVLLVASSVLRELPGPRRARGRRALAAGAGTPRGGSRVVARVAPSTASSTGSSTAPAVGLLVAVLLAASTAVALVATAVRLLTAVS